MPRGPFDELIREVKKLERPQTLRVPIESDEKGYYDKECPGETCLFTFKTNAEDWHALFHDEAVFCPRCGHRAPADHWWTQEQLDHARRMAVLKMKADVGRALQRGASGFNRSWPRTGFLQMSMKVRGTPATPIIFPATAREALEQELQCDSCKARYALLGSAFFCPCCGHNSIERLFDVSLTKTLARLDALPLIRSAFDTAGQPDRGEDTCRDILESSLQDPVTAFQHLCEHVYGRVPGARPPRRNVFQNLDEGSALWGAAIGWTYDACLAPNQLAELKTLFQKRHLLAHRNGIVDQDYIDRSADVTYRVGQRIVVSPQDIRLLVGLVQRLAGEIRARVP